MTNVNDVVAQRGSRYGSFTANAETAQAIKAAYAASPNWQQIPAYHKECLEMIAHKIARVLNGDFNYDDNYVDIAGYAQNVVNILREQQHVD